MDFTCLIVEDDPHTSDIFVLMVKRLGLDVHIAKNGEQAIHEVQQLRPDIVVLDIHLPMVSGFDVINHIRSNPTLEHTKVMAVTADPSAHRAKEALLFDAFLVKPIQVNDLSDAVHQLIGENQT